MDRRKNSSLIGSHLNLADFRRPLQLPMPLFSVLLLAVSILPSCGGAGTPAAPPPPISISISPTAISVGFAATQSFTASVTGSSNTAVAWTVQEGAAGGSITGAGIYTAPGTQGAFHVVATSQADTTKSAIAIVTVTAPSVTVPSVSVAITPAAVGIRLGATQVFTAMVTGSSNTAVTWAVQEGAVGGTITDSGVYTAPTTVGTYHVVATSVADASKSVTAAVSVLTSGFFTPTGNMRSVRTYHTATVLPNGKVLVAGGSSEGTCFCDITTPSNSAELFDLVSGTFDSTGSLGTPREAHTATLLPNGKVLVAGGVNQDNGIFDQATETAELYDPAVGSFTSTGSMGTARTGHTATLLPSGKVLIVGGDTTNSGGLASAELYDPATGFFTPTGSMGTARGQHTATLLPNGKVLIVGGGPGGPIPGSFASAELYDPAVGSFTSTGSMGTARTGHTATLLPSGQVLVAGGDGATAELYDPAAGSFAPTGSMTSPRWGATATLLPNGQVLVAGGNGATAELYE